MENYQKIIDKHFENFMESNKRFSKVNIRMKKRKIRAEYIDHFVDEWDSTGFIFYKPILHRAGRLYMFKGKPYEPFKFPRIKGINIGQRIKRIIAHSVAFFMDKPDWKMRNKAERDIRKVVALEVGALFILFSPIIYVVLFK